MSWCSNQVTWSIEPDSNCYFCILEDLIHLSSYKLLLTWLNGISFLSSLFPIYWFEVKFRSENYGKLLIVIQSNAILTTVQSVSKKKYCLQDLIQNELRTLEQSRKSGVSKQQSYGIDKHLNNFLHKKWAAAMYPHTLNPDALDPGGCSSVWWFWSFFSW